MELFAEIVFDFQSLSICRKSSFLDVWQCSEYMFVITIFFLTFTLKFQHWSVTLGVKYNRNHFISRMFILFSELFLFYPAGNNCAHLILATENNSHLSAPVPAILVISVEEKARSIFFKWTDSKVPTTGAPHEYVVRYKWITYMYKFTGGFLMISGGKEKEHWPDMGYTIWSQVNHFFHNAEKWPNILLKSCGVNTARF